MSGEVFFYHMTRTPLEATLPVLLHKSVAAGWRVLVRGRDADMLKWLDQKLWLGADDSFLAHGLAGGDHDAEQPVLLSVEAVKNPSFEALVSVGGAEVDTSEIATYQRVMVLFDGADADALAHARTQWKAVTAAGAKAKYWSDQSGHWEMKAET